MLCTLRKRVGVNAVTLDVGPDEELKEVGGSSLQPLTLAPFLLPFCRGTGCWVGCDAHCLAQFEKGTLEERLSAAYEIKQRLEKSS